MKPALMKRLFLLALPFCTYVFAAAGPYDGKWWLAASKDERTGFIAGYLDCELYDVGRKELGSVSVYGLEPQVTKYYQDHPGEQGRPVATLLLRFRSREQARGAASDGERYPGKHGFFDGEYWRQNVPAHRLGFIEGYLTCQRKEGKPTATFSRTPDSFVAEISRWYGVKADDPGEIKKERSGKKIADVLYLLRDKTGMTKTQ